MKQSNVATAPDALAYQSLEERMLQSVRMHYQSNHQEEFLHLKAQIESLFAKLQTLAEHDNADILVARR
ncbi:MAG: hypothetical protein WCD18_04460 [Thermosynechococcaceae cyanobacterium]